MARLADVNTTDIPSAIRLGCRCMCSVFDADDDNRPFFGSILLPEPRLLFSANHSESHVPGRHLNALLNAEDVLGLALDDEAIANHRRAAFFSYSAAAPLPLNRERKEDPAPTRFLPHNVREGFHALYALVKYRQCEESRKLAEASIAWILDHWSAVEGWDAELERLGVFYDRANPRTFIVGLGRAVGPLVKYYRATGHGPALDLALALADKACAEFFRPEGSFDSGLFGTHTHSTTCVMSGLAQLAELLRDAPLLDRVKAFYDNGLRQIRDALGWVIEKADREGNNADLGEVNNTGDIVETALILGAAGFAEYYEDAERILRCHLLPSQLRDTSFAREGPNPTGEDGRRDVVDRHRGAFGFPAPYGHRPLGAEWVGFNMDIVGGAVGSLCEAYRHIVRREDSGLCVNLLFDYEDEDVRVQSPYTGPSLRVTVKRRGPLWVRLPSWAEADVPSAPAGRRVGSRLFFPDPCPGQTIEVPFELATRELTLKHKAHDIRVRLRGDAVAAMDSFGAGLTFFEEYE